VKLKSEPVTVAELMITGAVPVELSVSDCVAGDPTVTLPNVRLAALRVNCGLGAAVPMPFRFTVAVAFVDESLSTVKVPVTVPAAVGANCTSKVTV
jgi:hypothetical protein